MLLLLFKLLDKTLPIECWRLGGFGRWCTSWDHRWRKCWSYCLFIVVVIVIDGMVSRRSSCRECCGCAAVESARLLSKNFTTTRSCNYVALVRYVLVYATITCYAPLMVANFVDCRAAYDDPGFCGTGSCLQPREHRGHAWRNSWHWSGW